MKNLSESLKAKARLYGQLSNEQKQKLIQELYHTQGMSWANIGEMTGTYANKVRRDAKKLGIKSRDKSEAQKQALEAGRHPHPTKDVGHTVEAKLKISESIADVWEGLSDKEREARRLDAKRRWALKSPEEIKAFRDAAGEGVRKAAKEGSALEKFLLEALITEGYRVEFHKEQWVIREKLQMDLYLPEQNVCLEVDGPSHFEDIWGEDQLSKNQQRDAQKTGLLLERGMCIIRVRQKQSLSQKYKRDILANVLDSLKKVEKSFPPRGKRHIILGD